MRPDELERRLGETPRRPRPAPRAELLHVLILPDFEHAERIGEFWGLPAEPRLRRAADRLRGGSDATGGTRPDAARTRVSRPSRWGTSGASGAPPTLWVSWSHTALDGTAVTAPGFSQTPPREANPLSCLVDDEDAQETSSTPGRRFGRTGWGRAGTSSARCCRRF